MLVQDICLIKELMRKVRIPWDISSLAGSSALTDDYNKLVQHTAITYSEVSSLCVNRHLVNLFLPLDGPKLHMLVQDICLIKGLMRRVGIPSIINSLAALG